MKIIAILEKNARQLGHSKRSSLIILIAPLIIIILLGITLQGGVSLQGIKAGILVESEGVLTDAFLENVHKKGFEVNILSSLNECIQSVKGGVNHVCVQIKERSSPLSKVDSRFGHELIFWVDFSRVRVVWGIINNLNQIVAQENAKISDEITQKINNGLEDSLQQADIAKEELSQFFRMAEALDNHLQDTQNIVERLDNFDNEVQTTQSQVTSLITALDQYYAQNMAINTSGANDPDQFYHRQREILSDINSNLERLQNDPAPSQRLATELNLIRDEFRKNVQKLHQAENEYDDLREEVEIFKGINVQDILNPIPSKVSAITGESGSISSNYLDFLLPGILVMIVMFDSMLLGTTLIMKERNSSGHFRNLISPTPRVMFLLGILLTGIFLIIIQLSILLLLAKFVFGAAITKSTIVIICGLLLLATVFYTLLGMIIGYIFDSEETATIASVSVSILFFLFSPFLVPLETLPHFVATIVGISPLVFIETSLRKIMLFSVHYSNIQLSFIFIFIFIIILAGLLFLIQKWKDSE